MYAKQFLNSVGDIKKKDTNTIISESTKGTIVGASIGAALGLFIGFSKEKNLLMSSFIGAVIGGGIARFIKK
jgi:uncharacterized membrane protein YeaQ/YmgE (transglycosylase-associated protein family)